MPITAHKYTFNMVSTSISTADFASEISDPVLSDERAGLPFLPLDQLRTFDLPGIFSGTFNFTISPAIGSTIADDWNQSVRLGEQVVATVIQVAIGTEPASPSDENPSWEISFFPRMSIGGPVSHGDIRQYDVSNSVSLLRYDVGAGFAIQG